MSLCQRVFSKVNFTWVSKKGIEILLKKNKMFFFYNLNYTKIDCLLLAQLTSAFSDD